MNYQEKMNEQVQKYTELRKRYDELVENSSYRVAMFEGPFEFINTKWKISFLSMYEHLGKEESHFGKNVFSSVQEASDFFLSLVALKKKSASVLENASIINQAQKAAIELNEFVKNSGYLADSLTIPVDNNLLTLTEDILRELPEMSNLLTKEFKHSFVQSMLDTFPTEDITKLVQMKIISANDFEFLRIDGTPEYLQKLKALQHALGIENIHMETLMTRIAGTTFQNESGTTGQEVLKSLDGKKLPIALESQATKWKPAGETTERNAIKLSHDSKMIGYVPQQDVDYLYGKYEEPKVDVSLEQLTGGGTANYGAQIKVSVIARDLVNEPDRAEN